MKTLKFLLILFIFWILFLIIYTIYQSNISYNNINFTATLIRNDIFLGSKNDANNLYFLQYYYINYILNVADNVINYYPNDFIYKNLKVKDFGQDKGIIRVFNDAIDFINLVRSNNGKVLIHCAHGINRSVTITIAYLMKTESLSLLDAWNDVKSKRKQASIFRDNREQLLIYEKQLYGYNSLTSKQFTSLVKL